MTIENSLERIANALEVLASRPTGTPTGATKIDAAIAQADAAERPRARGRPAKITEKEKAAAAEGETVTKDKPADFLDGPKPQELKKVKVDDVRAALKSYMLRINPETGVAFGNPAARAMLTKHGGGAVRLEEDKAKGDEGKNGILESRYYQDVIDAVAEPATDEF